MKMVKYTIRTISPILISSESGNQFMVPTKDYITGITILGALAAKYINKQKLNVYFQQGTPTDDNFLDWFINGKVKFSNAYKMDKRKAMEGDTNKFINYASYPMPFSVQSLKNSENEIYDLFYNKPDEQTKPVGGFGCLKSNELYKTDILKELSPHHERDYTTGVAKQTKFFNYESISADQTFEGTISGDDKAIGDFYDFFKSTNNLRIGRSRTSEYGEVEFSLSEDSSSDSIKISPNNNGTISLTFLSNVFIYNDYGFPTSDILELEKYLKMKLSDSVSIKEVFLKSEEIENYVSVWKLKKTSEVSFQAGSCLLLEFENIDEEKLKKLEELQISGIGERRHEGFGRIIFGLQRDVKKLTKAESIKESAAKPLNTSAPKLVTDAVMALAAEYLNKAAVVEALEKVSVSANKAAIRKELTSSQISRLEGFVRKTKTENEFKEKVAKLRKISKEKLTGCNFDGTNLFLFLTSNKITDTQENKQKEIEALFKDVSLNEAEATIAKIKNDLYKAYYLTLFAAMRKALKGGN